MRITRSGVGDNGDRKGSTGRLSWRNVTASAGARSLCAVVGLGLATRGTEYLLLVQLRSVSTKSHLIWVWDLDGCVV